MQNNDGHQPLEVASRASDARPSKLPQAQSPSGGGGVAGGFFIALFVLVGTFVGGLKGEPVIGLLVGLAVGIVIAIAMWLVDRAKGRP